MLLQSTATLIQTNAQSSVDVAQLALDDLIAGGMATDEELAAAQM